MKNIETEKKNNDETTVIDPCWVFIEKVAELKQTLRDKRCEHMRYCALQTSREPKLTQLDVLTLTPVNGTWGAARSASRWRRWAAGGRALP